jgi:arginase family enzyme
LQPSRVFLGTERSNSNAAICVAGVPFDLGTSNRPGARFGPAAIRQASRMLVDGDHPASWAEIDKLDLADIGDFRIAHGDIEGSLKKIEAQAASVEHLVALGGDHTITIALLRALARRKGGALGLVHFDGHVDTWPESFGLAWGHGSPFYHAIEEGLIEPHHAIQIGIRSPMHREIFDWTIGQGVRIVTAEEVHETGPRAVADVVEVSPPYDVAEITALAAATVAWDYIAQLSPHAKR